MALNKTEKAELAEVVGQALNEALAKEREAFGVPAEEHYNDHRVVQEIRGDKEEFDKDKMFVRGLRSKAKTIGKASTWSLVGAAIAFFGTAITWYLKDVLK